MFERFTDRARRVVVLAQEEARLLNHNYIGTEHLLLGLLREGEGVAATVLRSAGVSIEAARQQVEELIGPGQRAPSGHIPFTPRSKTALELSLRESSELGDSDIGTEHILLGLIRESDTVAAQLLVRLGADLDSVRHQAIGLSRQRTQTGPTDPAALFEQQVGSIWSRYTDRARKAIVLAQEEAGLLNHNYIGTEHLLLGLIHEGRGVAVKALESLGVSLEAVRRQVEEIIGRGLQASSGPFPFTPRAKKVLELALREALQLGHNYIGTEHVLLGLIREGDGVAAQVLVSFGADLRVVRQQVIQLLHGFSGGPEPAAGGRLETARPARAGGTLARVVRLAEAEAVALGHGYVGTEHLLLGLLLTEDAGGEIGELLDASVTADAVRALVAGLTGPGTSEGPGPRLTPEALDALDLAACEARCEDRDEVGATHLMVALAGADGSIAMRLMWELGVPGRATELTQASGGGTAAGGEG